MSGGAPVSLILLVFFLLFNCLYKFLGVSHFVTMWLEDRATILFASFRHMRFASSRKVLLSILIILDTFPLLLVFVFFCLGLFLGFFVMFFSFTRLVMLFPKLFLFLMAMPHVLFLHAWSLEFHWQKAYFLQFCKITTGYF